MEIITLILLLAVQGLLIGALARLAVPGRDPLSLLQTLGVGLAGSFIGGLLVYAIGGEDAAGWSFVAALLVAVGIIVLIRRSRRGTAGGPGGSLSAR
ncbi:MAG TPA: hypothetical protein VE526_07780 [Solirubrobacteraceae bacterium]|jgi:uncharacterized membrane protein YeaQ/YmgE (transglycosylase-associated protein family)|nr:hypothetical protein [Solirubrobacteraceae bacterium]